jgi:hypothetical protein
MRVGILNLFKYSEDTSIFYYEKDGVCVRHPTDAPWNNPKNFSRDQLIPLVAGFYGRDLTEKAKRVFWAHAKRFFFCQNSERDVPGSTKYPWPHSFVNDKGQEETRKFDFRDFLMPDGVFHLIKCARIYPLYLFGLIGLPWLALSIYGHSKSSHKEHNQILCQCKVAGKWALRLFVKLVPNWKEDLREYYGSRNEMEYADIIIQDVERSI